MKSLERALNALITATAIIAGACVIIMMVHMAADVLSRMLLGRSLTGTIAFVMNYYMVVVVCLPLAYVERLDQHIAVDVVTDRLNSRLRYHMRAWTWLVTAGIYGILTHATWIEAMQKYRRGAYVVENDLILPIWFGYFTLPVGAGLLSIYLVLKFLAYLTGTPLEGARDKTVHTGEGAP